MLAGSVIGPLVAGIMSDHIHDGYALSFILIAVLSTVGAVMIFFSPPPKPSRLSVPAHNR